MQIEPKKPRKQNRKRSTANVAVAWSVYDELDKLATQHDTSMSQVIRAMLKERVKWNVLK